MATLADLESAIDSLLNHPLGAAQYQLIRRVEEKAYEAYVFGLCLRAVRELGVLPVLRGISGLPTPFIFRGGPGQIHSENRNYGFAEFSLNGHAFEIHAGVEFKGSSGMTHELDVCMMRQEEADKCRQDPDDPASSSLVCGWECKFYDRRLDKVLGRAFVGLVADLGPNLRLSGFCSNLESTQLSRYFHLKGRPHPHFLLSPLDTSNEQIFTNQIKGALKKLTEV
jgi:hypothetical protein